ncbi:MAG TPA: hypothetical protein VGJ08_00075 [Rhizomicrobium sp.]|jgi:hypothetical protein
MSTRYPTRNPLDRIFLGIANLVIVLAGAVVLYHCVVTSIDPPPYEAAAVARFPSPGTASVAAVAHESDAGTCVDRVRVAIVR